MAYDPYGYETDDAPAETSSGGAVAAFLAIIYGLCALCCTGLDLAITSTSTEPWHDKVGIFSLLGWPICVAASAAFFTVGMWMAARRLWTSLGPSLIAGLVVGTGLWVLFFFMAIVNKLAIEGG